MNLSHPAHPVSTHRQMRVSLFGRVSFVAHPLDEGRDQLSDRVPALQRSPGLSAADLEKVLSVVHASDDGEKRCPLEPANCVIAEP
jgi:hypothetical protein